ncbi:MAG: 4Fe-4S dicluster domain-containing protein [Myxococcales bacterium]|jgi:formate hydrogenlyase subunit 6/NADH:ubiquinone oxidoreductase subunit I|nr:4Fe-4S dicluster domain-containing protein [Myxococcales bacterium]
MNRRDFLEGLLTPVMDFETAFCNFDCTRCAQACPRGALPPLTREEKQRIQVCRAAFDRGLGIVNTDGTYCGACSEHCPTQAVQMVPVRDGLTIPEVDADGCVGCGACE